MPQIRKNYTRELKLEALRLVKTERQRGTYA